MGLWNRLFGSTSKVIEHPVLGRISREAHNLWTVDEIESLGCRGNPSLSLAGTEEGPAPECVTTYQRLREEWANIAPEIARDIFEQNQNYFSDEPLRALSSPEDVWPTSELLDISVYSEGGFSLTYQFDWQDAQDGHITTVYFENW